MVPHEPTPKQAPTHLHYPNAKTHSLTLTPTPKQTYPTLTPTPHTHTLTSTPHTHTLTLTPTPPPCTPYPTMDKRLWTAEKGRSVDCLCASDLRLFQHIYADKVFIAHKNILLQQNSKSKYQKVRYQMSTSNLHSAPFLQSTTACPS